VEALLRLLWAAAAAFSERCGPGAGALRRRRLLSIAEWLGGGGSVAAAAVLQAAAALALEEEQPLTAELVGARHQLQVCRPLHDCSCVLEWRGKPAVDGVVCSGPGRKHSTTLLVWCCQ
jgi:hypothetical protein